MGRSVVTTVIEALNNAGIRAAAAFPGQIAADLTQPAAAVSLFQVNQQQRLTEVLVTVLCPVSMGGAACEAEALRVTEVLTNTGASCVQEICEFDSRRQLLTVPVYAAFRGGIWEAAWIPGGDLTVKLGTTELLSATNFISEQITEDPVATALSGCPWKFSIEEFFYPGYSEENTPSEPFSVTVTRTTRTETYKNCRFTAIKREAGPTGLRQIREGIADSMIHMAIA